MQVRDTLATSSSTLQPFCMTSLWQYFAPSWPMEPYPFWYFPASSCSCWSQQGKFLTSLTFGELRLILASSWNCSSMLYLAPPCSGWTILTPWFSYSLYICMFVCVSPPSEIYCEASHWPWDHMNSFQASPWPSPRMDCPRVLFRIVPARSLKNKEVFWIGRMDRPRVLFRTVPL